MWTCDLTKRYVEINGTIGPDQADPPRRRLRAGGHRIARCWSARGLRASSLPGCGNSRRQGRARRDPRNLSDPASWTRKLGIKVTEACLAPFVFASHGYEDFHLLMPLFLCRRWEGFVQAKEHAALRWVKPSELSDLPMPPADLPLTAYLRDFL